MGGDEGRLLQAGAERAIHVAAAAKESEWLSSLADWFTSQASTSMGVTDDDDEEEEEEENDEDEDEEGEEGGDNQGERRGNARWTAEEAGPAVRDGGGGLAAEATAAGATSAEAASAEATAAEATAMPAAPAAPSSDSPTASLWICELFEEKSSEIYSRECAPSNFHTRGGRALSFAESQARVPTRWTRRKHAHPRSKMPIFL